MKLATFMDSFNKKQGLSPNVPITCPPLPNTFSPAPYINSPPSPPPLMSINTFPELPSEIISPPRKSRRKEKTGFVLSNGFSVLPKREENWPRYYVLSKKEGNFSNISPFLYCQQIVNSIGKPKLVQKMASGALNIEAANMAQANALRDLKKLGDYEIIVESNKRRNTSKGVVVCRDFMVCTEEELKTGMADQGVIDVKRINRRQGGTLVATASLILTFDTPEPPEQIEAAYYKLKVRKFIPSPMRCFKCLKFGHTSFRCRSLEQMCACGLIVHNNAPCQDPPVCINCADPHSSRSLECTVFKEEKEIQKVKTLQNLPYQEARELVRSRSFAKPNVSYASAVKVKQTERKDWSKILQPFIFSGSQGPSKPVWMTQDPKAVHPSLAPIKPTVAGDSHPPSSEGQGNPLVSLPVPSTLSAATGQSTSSEFRLPISTRLPQRSPPRKERPLRKAQTIKPLIQPQNDSQGTVDDKVGAQSSDQNALRNRGEPINWVSSREEHGSDSETGDSNRTVLTDTPVERPIVRRKRKNMPKTQKK